jgi:outer membrane immunogenic protein
MISRLICAAVATAGFAAITAAAAPAMAQDSGGTPYNGWYIGGNLGGTWGDNSLHLTASQPPTPTNPIVIPPADVSLINAGSNNSNKTGFTGGIEGGYNWLAGNWLFGIETEFSALDINENQSNSYQSTALTVNPLVAGSAPVVYTANQRAKTNWMWTLRPRLGYVSGPWLFFASAGLATADIKVTMDFSDNRTPPDSIHNDSSSTKTGWAGGLGVAYAAGPQWSLKGEWLYTDFGKISTSATTSTGFATLTSQANVRANLFRVGVDYRF